MTASAVLVLNCGSSSVKFALVDPPSGRRLISGVAERVGTPEVSLEVDAEGQQRTSTPRDGSVHGILVEVLAAVGRVEGVEVGAVGHRVVHGGQRFSASVVVDDATTRAIADLADLAPLHNPANVAGIRAVSAVLPDVPQVAVFDTAFHQSMPPRAYRYAVPKQWYDDYAVRRYGFHGTSHRYVSACAAELLDRPASELRLVTAHLGNGCSATAVRDGRSVDTSMGLTPLEGLVMGTRSGDVDPGLLRYGADRSGCGVEEVLDALNTRSGLLGLSGVSNDLREVSEAADGGSADAALALEVFAYRLAKYVAALVVPLGRLDALVFTGGVGEHSVGVRHAVLGQLGFLGLHEDPDANARHGRDTGGRITAAGATQALVVPTDEELVIARDTAALTGMDAG
jgi:acetate kinase